MSKSDNRWIITALRFKEHETYESMETELARLRARHPDKPFRSIRIKRTTEDVGRVVDFVPRGLHDFANRLRILTSIDQDELVKAGIESMRDTNVWRSFMGDPSRWLMRASDDDADRIWSVIEARATRTQVAPGVRS